MGLHESAIRAGTRAAMRVVEARVAHSGPLGTATPGAGGGRNVLLVHGYGNNGSSWKAVRESLERDGFRVQTVDLPNFGFGDVMDDAKVVGERVAEMTAVNGAPVTVVGHSRGGLVARAWKQLQAPHSDARVITVSSANQGVHLGKLDGIAGRFLPEGMRHTRRGAELIRRLAEAPTDGISAIGTKGFDGVLPPASTARIPGAPFHAVDEGRTFGPLSRVGHWEILRDDVAYETLRGALLAAG